MATEFFVKPTPNGRWGVYTYRSTFFEKEGRLMIIHAGLAWDYPTQRGAHAARRAFLAQRRAQLNRRRA